MTRPTEPVTRPTDPAARSTDPAARPEVPMPGAEAPLVLLRIAALPFATLAPLAAGEALARLAPVQELEDRLDAEVARLTGALHAVAGEPPDDGDPEAAHLRLARQAVIGLRRALHNRRRVPESQLAALRGILPPELFGS